MINDLRKQIGQLDIRHNIDLVMIARFAEHILIMILLPENASWYIVYHLSSNCKPVLLFVVIHQLK